MRIVIRKVGHDHKDNHQFQYYILMTEDRLTGKLPSRMYIRGRSQMIFVLPTDYENSTTTLRGKGPKVLQLHSGPRDETQLIAKN